MNFFVNSAAYKKCSCGKNKQKVRAANCVGSRMNRDVLPRLGMATAPMQKSRGTGRETRKASARPPVPAAGALFLPALPSRLSMAAAPAVAQQASPRFCLRLWLLLMGDWRSDNTRGPDPPFSLPVHTGFLRATRHVFPGFFATCDICPRRSGAEGFSPGLFAKRPLSRATAPALPQGRPASCRLLAFLWTPVFWNTRPAILAPISPPAAERKVFRQAFLQKGRCPAPQPLSGLHRTLS